ncbi:MAG: hypothetical protein NTW16_16065 [Bacteroidetes bacterium]|nr:hypothetical protein [Bacteroidota bacterium]
MKTTITILAAVLTLNAGILFAGNEISSAPIANESTFITLAPSAPMVATFEDAAIALVDFVSIAPVTPVEADFSDVAPDATIDLTNLAPLTPAMADFNDVVDVAIDTNALAPVAPATADFE